MASGYFPVREDEEWGKVLKNCVEEIEKIISTYYDDDLSADLNSDDAFDDGQCISSLNTAVSFIKKCLYKK